jgi:cyclopropane-fatty-acyl-phospholipid synthase
MTNNTSKQLGNNAGLIDRWLRGRVEKQLQSLRVGRITLVDAGKRLECGDVSSDLQATITVQHPRFYRRVAWGADLGAAESLMDGDWTCDDLTALVRILIRNMPVVTDRASIVQRMQLALAKAAKFFRRNTRHGSARNIRSHYDLSNDFFELFLDTRAGFSTPKHIPCVRRRSRRSIEHARLSTCNRMTTCWKLAPVGARWPFTRRNTMAAV